MISTKRMDSLFGKTQPTGWKSPTATRRSCDSGIRKLPSGLSTASMPMRSTRRTIGPIGL